MRNDKFLQMPIVNYPDESLKIKTKPEQKVPVGGTNHKLK